MVMTITIENCYATGDVDGGDYVGGLVGYNYYGTIENCYATGDVDGGDSIGGLAGYNDQGIIRYSYSTGKPTGTSDVGGLVGDKITGGDYEDTDNYWDTTTSETTTSAMGTGKTTTQMQDIDTFVGNWDMVTEANHDGDEATAVWFIDDGNDYPRLWFEWEASGEVQEATGKASLTTLFSTDLSKGKIHEVSGQSNIITSFDSILSKGAFNRLSGEVKEVTGKSNLTTSFSSVLSKGATEDIMFNRASFNLIPVKQI